MKNIILTFALVAILLVSCTPDESDKCHKYTTVYNGTGNRIYVLKSGGYPNPDAYKIHLSPIVSAYKSKVESNEANNRCITENDCLESIFEPAAGLSGGVLMVYIFDGTVIETTSWDTIKKYNMYLKRYDMKLNDFRATNFTIAYTGS